MAQLPVTYSAEERIWSGLPVACRTKDVPSLGEIIFNNMKKCGQNVCQIWDDEDVIVTFDQALSWAIRLAEFFKKRGLGHKEVIGISAENSKYLLSLGVACLMNGTPFHSLNPVLDRDTHQQLFMLTKPLLVFCDGKIYEKIYKATFEWQPEIYILTDQVEGVPSIELLLEPTTTEEFYKPEPLKEGGDQTVAILCSSGTTGLPKAVCISNRSLLPTPSALLNSDSVGFSYAALDWISGVASFISHTAFGFTRILSRTLVTPEYLVQLVEKYKISTIVLAPFRLSALINCPAASSESLASLRCVFCSGGIVSGASLQRCQKLCKNATFSQIYALTEAGNISMALSTENGNSVGRPLPGVKIRIVSEEGENLKHNQVGEIYAHTELVWRGYYGNPEESLRFRDSEGWFHTGDLGYFDDQNLLYIVDRCKDTLKYQGQHYWPGEIEQVILELCQVQHVCVVGIYDEKVGDEAGALVVKRKGLPLQAEEIVDHVAQRLPKFKQLHAGVQFADEMPVNQNGKILKKAAREIFLAKRKLI
ncbi:luciferin 4-monooxygenase-like [Drosophila kikkawai]|uniref:Luciferin 4-monooxygenase-like n=1 Tax=Drosophila kikkawai TaxID=30033 RepID=A0A6P4IHS1_DROKI|nr:luciferin 4-monooxygenase-like [Drosophila kikkawai]